MAYAEGGSQILVVLNQILVNEESEGEDDSNEDSGDDFVPALPNYINQEWFILKRTFGLSSPSVVVSVLPISVRTFKKLHLHRCVWTCCVCC